MARLVLKLFLYVCCVLVVNMFVSVSVYDENRLMAYFQKREELRKNYPETNVLFFGSSRTQTHLVPAVFDSMNALNNVETSSFNMALSGAFLNEQFYVLNDFFRNPKATAHLDYILLELDDSVLMPEDAQNTVKGSYYLRLRDLPRIFRQIIRSDCPVTKKFSNVNLFISSYMMKILRTGNGREIIHNLVLNNGTKNRSHILNKGFYGHKIPKAGIKSPSLIKQHQSLMQDTMYVERNFQRYTRLSDGSAVSGKFDKGVSALYKDFIEKMKEKGVYVICMIPVKNNLAENLMRLYQDIPPEHRMNMTARPDIEKLKPVKYWFDTGHLNEEGATIYSRMVSDEFRKVVK